MIPAAILSLIMSIEGQIAAPEAELLYLRASEATVCIVEIGSFRGRSTIALALGSKAGHNVPVYAIDPHEATGDGDYPYGPTDRVAFMRNVIEAGVADIVRMVNLPAKEVMNSYHWNFDVLFIDGDHESPEPWNDLDNGTDLLVGDGVVIMHDRHADGVQEAIHTLNVKDKWHVVDGPGSIVEIWRK